MLQQGQKRLQQSNFWSSRAFLWDTATHCNTMQHNATHCNTLQHAVSDMLAAIKMQRHSRSSERKKEQERSRERERTRERERKRERLGERVGERETERARKSERGRERQTEREREKRERAREKKTREREEGERGSSIIGLYTARIWRRGMCVLETCLPSNRSKRNTLQHAVNRSMRNTLQHARATLTVRSVLLQRVAAWRSVMHCVAPRGTPTVFQYVAM